MAETLTDVLRSTEPVLQVGVGGATEGPVWHGDGSLTFTKFKSSQLMRLGADGNLTVVRSDTGYGNGCALDREGRLLMCEGDNRRVTRTEPDGSVHAIAERWKGKRLNKPNDVVCRSDGTVYFTDPELRVPREERDLGFSGVFFVTPDGRLELGTDECEYPNGLAFSPDESVLYVAISRLDERCFEEEENGRVCTHRRIRAFDVAPDGSLSNNRVFVDMSSAEPGVPDGMKVDTDGRVYCTGSGGIWVIEPDCERLGIIRVPELPRNLVFGGRDLSTLYITAGDSVYTLETSARGAVDPYEIANRAR